MEQFRTVARWALCMLFTFTLSTPVNAQLGGLVKKAKSVANRSDANESNRVLNRKVT